jgi:hypothetical protein
MLVLSSVIMSSSFTLTAPDGGFNGAFVASAPPGGPTGFEWLSRDPGEVQKYVDDPWCGLPLTNGFVADNMKGRDEIWAPGSEERIPKDIPVLSRYTATFSSGWRRSWPSPH